MSLNLKKTDFIKLNHLVKDSLDKKYELEARFGTYRGNHFTPGVSYNSFKRLIQFFNNNKLFENIETTELLTINDNNNKEDFKLYKCASGIDTIKKLCHNEDFDGDNISYKIKDKRKSIVDITNYNIRIEKSLDTEDSPTQKSKEQLLNSKHKNYRYKKRYSFLSINKIFRFDLSLTKNSPSSKDRQNGFLGFSNFYDSKILEKNITYEVEIEYLPSNISSGSNKKLIESIFNEFINNIYLCLKIIDDTIVPMSIDDVEETFKEYVASFYPEPNFNLPKNKKNYFLGADTSSISAENLVDIKESLDNISNINSNVPLDYAVTEKADGERCLLFINKNNDCFLINNRIEFKNVGFNVNTDLGGTLIDGEYLNKFKTFLSFDILFYKGTDVRNNVFNRTNEQKIKNIAKSRYEILKSLYAIISSKRSKLSSQFSIKLKEHHFCALKQENIISISKQIWENRKTKFPYQVDGLIFTPRNEYYHNVSKGFLWKSLLKWKPHYYHSIDFLIKLHRERGNIVKNLIRKFDKTSNKHIVEYYTIAYLYVGARKNGTYVRDLFEPTTGSEHRKIPCYIAKIKVNNDGNIYAKDPVSDSTEVILDNTIVEFIYDKDKDFGFEWVPIRNRHDKTEIFNRTKSISHTANDINIATANWNLIHEGNGFILQDNIFTLLMEDWYRKNLVSIVREKKYESSSTNNHNILIIENNHVIKPLYVNITNYIVDKFNKTDIKLLLLGTNRGIHINKYFDTHNIRKIHAIDEDKNDIKDFETRFDKTLSKKDNNIKLEWILQGDFTNLLTYGDSIQGVDKETLNNFYKTSGFYYFDLIINHNTINKAFKNEYTLRAFIHNIFLNLQVGGYFVGTVLDGNNIYKRFIQERENIIQGGTSKTGIWKIEKLFNEKSLLNFGQEISVQFTNVSLNEYTQYLVNFEYMTNILKEEYDIEIISDTEAQNMGLPSGTGSYQDFYYKMLENDDPLIITDSDKEFLFLHRYFIFKKIGTGDAVIMKKWNTNLSSIQKIQEI